MHTKQTLAVLALAVACATGASAQCLSEAQVGRSVAPTCIGLPGAQPVQVNFR